LQDILFVKVLNAFCKGTPLRVQIPKLIPTQVVSACTLPATVLTLGNAETRMYNIIASETFDLCFTSLDTITGKLW
jgi:hypothetical protein